MFHNALTTEQQDGDRQTKTQVAGIKLTRVSGQ